MSGLGRRSHYRKHLTSQILSDYPTPNPEEGEYVGMVICSRGGNIVEVMVDQRAALPTDEASNQSDDGHSLALLPTKFKNLVYIKRGDFVILQSAGHTQSKANAEKSEAALALVEGTPSLLLEAGAAVTGSDKATSVSSNAVGTTAGSAGNKVSYLLQTVLFKDQVKHIKKLDGGKLWPSEFEVSMGDDDEEEFVQEEEVVDSGSGNGIVWGNPGVTSGNKGTLSSLNIESSEGEGGEAAAVVVVPKKKVTQKLDKMGNTLEVEVGSDDEDEDGLLLEDGDYEDDDYYAEEGVDDGLFVNYNKLAAAGRDDDDDDSSDSDSD